MRLEAKGLGFRYSRTKKWIFRNRDISFTSDERTALLGDSGVGKSTLAKVLAGYYKPTEGNILSDKQIGYRSVQLIHQHPEKAINPRFKMQDVVSEGFIPDQKLLDNLGIQSKWMNRYPSELSGGELQRFCIARALGPATRFIIADEISAMLDAITQAQIWGILLKEAEERNIGIIVITHDKALAKRVCSRVMQFAE